MGKRRPTPRRANDVGLLRVISFCITLQHSRRPIVISHHDVMNGLRDPKIRDGVCDLDHLLDRFGYSVRKNSGNGIRKIETERITLVDGGRLVLDVIREVDSVDNVARLDRGYRYRLRVDGRIDDLRRMRVF